MSKPKPKHLKPEMALAVLEDRKKQTRMPINDFQLQAIDFDKLDPIMNKPPFLKNGKWFYELQSKVDDTDIIEIKAKYKIGDVLYIRERARLIKWIPNIVGNGSEGNGCGRFRYEADETLSEWIDIPDRLKFIHYGNCVPNGCFRELARIFVKITGVRVERSEDMSLDDIIAEGIPYDNKQGRGHLREKWDAIWDSCYPELKGKPHWRFVYDFERCDKPCQ